MITVRAGSGAIGVCLLLLASGCSREQQDWRSAESADTIEAYGHFIQRHPESELATEARTRVAQLGEDRDWQHAGSADTVDAYRQFIAEHPNGKWAQEARIRIENFSLGEQAGTDAASKREAAGVSADGRRSGAAVASAERGARTGARVAGGDAGGPGAGSAASGATASVDGRGPSGATAGGARSYGLASPGEEAVPAAPPPSAPHTAAAAGQSSSAAVASSASGDSRAAGASRAAGVAGAAGATGSAARPPGAAGGYGIQLGAFSSEAGAENEWRALTGRFGTELQGLREHVVVADAASGRIYRLQAAVGDEARARAICSSLRNRGQGCVAVLPN